MGMFSLGFFGPAKVERIYIHHFLRALEFLGDIFLPTRLSWSFFVSKNQSIYLDWFFYFLIS
jgi:hypothetical protein